MMKVDFGKLTNEETKAIALEALNNLTIDDCIEVIKQAIAMLARKNWRANNE